MKKMYLTGERGKWFDANLAESWDEETWWNGYNHESYATGRKWDHEKLFKTKSGNYVIQEWSDCQGICEVIGTVSKERAALWLIANHKEKEDCPEELHKFWEDNEI